MNPNRFKIARFGIALLASAAIAATGAGAQMQSFGAGAYREDAGSALSRHLRTLADNPRNHSALMGAGNAALQLGDPQAAVTFFARAEEIAPRDGRIKAGIGSAFVQMEQPHSALKFFSDAASLGVNEGEFAGDRGLAYDVIGNPKQAQRDYQIALRHKPDPEIERRLALSLAISGDKAGALAAIDAQVRRQDRAGWRTRAFVLALTGDEAGATQAVQSVMPAQAAALRPFLARLPALDLAGRAMAVHFGHFPGEGPAVQMAQNYNSSPPYSPTPSYTPTPSYGANQFAGTSSTPAPAYGRQQGTTARTTQPPRVSTGIQPRAGATQPRTQVENTSPRRTVELPNSRRRAVALEDRVGSLVGTPSNAQPQQRVSTETPRVTSPAGTGVQPVQFALSAPRVTPQQTVPAPTPNTATPVQSVPAAAPEVRQTPPPVAAPAPQVNTSTAAVVPPVQTPPVRTPPVQDAQLSGSSITTQPTTSSSALTSTPAPSVPSVTTPAPAPEVTTSADTPAAGEAKPSASGGGLADIAALVNALPATEVEKKPEPKPSLPKLAQVDVKTAPKPETKEPAKKAETTKKESAKQEAAKKDTSKKEPAKPAEPSRHWVQVAGGADRPGLVREFGKLKQKAPKLLGDRTPYTTPLRFTNRLLVGPFKSEDEAQAFVNELSKADLTAFSWTSPAGQEISKLTAK